MNAIRPPVYYQSGKLNSSCCVGVVACLFVAPRVLLQVTTLGRWLAVLYLPISVVFVNSNFAVLAVKLTSASQTRKMNKLLSTDLTLEGLNHMDKDGDGTVGLKGRGNTAHS